MTVKYEWDVETVTTVESEEREAGEVLDHYFCVSYREALWRSKQPAPEGCKYVIVLVRDDENSRSWAYMLPSGLPTFFTDASGNTIQVPVKYHREVEREKRP